MDMKDKMTKLKINAKQDSATINDKIAALTMKYSIYIDEERGAPVVLRAGKTHHASTLALAI